MLEHLQKRGGTVNLWNLLPGQTCPIANGLATRFQLKKPHNVRTYSLSLFS